MAVGVVRAPDDDRQPQLVRGLRLEALDAHRDLGHEPVAQLLRLRDEHAELRAVEARDPDRRHGDGAGEERRAEHDRELAEELAGRLPHGEPPLAVAVALHQVVAAGEQHVERGSIALAHEPLAGVDAHVGGERRSARERSVGHPVEHGQGAQLVELDHAASSS